MPPTAPDQESANAAQRELIISKLDSLREYVDLRFTSTDKAQVLDATEIKRRLEELNHAHSRAESDRDKFLPRETFDLYTNETRSAIAKALEATQAVDKRVADALVLKNKSDSDWQSKMGDRISNMEGRQAAYSVATVIGLTIIEIALRYIIK